MASENQQTKTTEGFEKFIKALEGHSVNVASILRCHLVAEYFLDQIIIANIIRGDLLLTEGNFSFTNKLLIVKSFAIIKSELLTSIKHLNSIRNSCSHQLSYEISEGDIDLIGRPFGKEYSLLKKDSADRTKLLKDVLMKIIARLEWQYEQMITTDKNTQKDAS